METGTFTLQEKQFLAGGKKFCLKNRKEPTEKKPELYLIQVQPFRYISSLFPLAGEAGTYTFDFEKQLYVLRMAESRVEVAEFE